MENVFRQVIGSGEGDSTAEGAWSTKKKFYALWQEFLAISPSYELARRYRAGELTDETLPEDFETVLAVYDDLGNVQRIDFDDWWRERGLRVFGFIGESPIVRKVDTLSNKRYRKASERVQSFIEGSWTAQGQPNSMLVSIPLGLTKAQVSRRLNKLMDRYSAEFRTLPEPVAKYPLLDKRLRQDSLVRYLFVVWVRSVFPRSPLWRVGALSKVSDTYSRELDGWARVPRGEKVYDRSVLAAITSRALSRGMAIAENAARGRFPCYDMPEHGVKPDIHEQWKIIRSRVLWKKKLKREADKKRKAEQSAAQQENNSSKGNAET